MNALIATHRFATATFALITVTLLVTISPIFAPARAAFWDGSAAQLIRDQSMTITVSSLILMMGALALAMQRRDKMIGLQHNLLRAQERNIEIHSKAIHEHSIVCETDPDGTIVDLNNGFELLFGYGRTEILGKNVDILYEDDRHDKNYLRVQDALAAGQVFSGEQKLLTKSGKIVTTMSTVVPLFDDDGVHIRNVSMRTDVTELRKSEADRHLTALLKKLQDEVYIYTVDTQSIVFMNDSALEKSNWTLDNAKAKKIHDTNKKFDADLFAEHVRPILNGDVQAVTARVWRDNDYVEIVTRMHVLSDDVPVFVSVCRDISERKKAELEKLKTVSYVSHELRAPLTSIIGALRLLKSGVSGDLSDDVTAIVDVAERNSERMLDVLSGILDLEKINAGKMVITCEPMDLVELVNDAVEMNKGYADQHGVEFTAAVMPNKCEVDGSPSHLLQVMTNLMSNAAKFSPKGDTVTIGFTEMGESLRVYVSDNGPGITEEDQAKVFDSFAQVEPVDGKYRNGTGLGLTISKKIIQLHSGQIGLESTVGEGTTFYFDLPKQFPKPEIQRLPESGVAAA